MKFEELPENDRQQLLKFPAYISLLAAHGHLGEKEKKEAVKFSHIKTFTCDPLLSGFYKSAEEQFLRDVEAIDANLPDNPGERELILTQKLAELEQILKRTDSNFSFVLHKSMKQFKDHVSKANRNILEYFLFPLPLEGISD